MRAFLQSMTDQKRVVALAGFVVLLGSIATAVIVTQHRTSEGLCSASDFDRIKRLQQFESEQKYVTPQEISIPGVPSEGTEIKVYDHDRGDYLMEVHSFATLARYETKYFVDDHRVFYVEFVTDEWDPKKLWGEKGQLSAAEGQYVVATSTREEYVIEGGQLCKYLSDREQSESKGGVSTGSIDSLKGLMQTFEFIQTKRK